MSARPATLADVAAAVGVHASTVSRALNDETSHQVSTATVRRVRRVAADLGYVPNLLARSLRKSSSMTVGVVIPDLTNPLFPPIVRGAESALSAAGYTTFVANTEDADAVEERVYATLRERQIDGLIIATSRLDHPALRSLHEQGVKAVLVNRGTRSAPFPLVSADDRQGIDLLVEHLALLGHQRITHLSGPDGVSTSEVRSEAFLRACDRFQIEGTLHVGHSFTIDGGIAAFEEIVAGGHALPTAIIAGTDLMALGCIRAMRARGLSCPHDISVTGYNDIAFSADFNPALTTVHVPQHRLGAEAARILMSAISSGTLEPVSVTLPVELVVRASTAAPGTASVPGVKS